MNRSAPAVPAPKPHRCSRHYHFGQKCCGPGHCNSSTSPFISKSRFLCGNLNGFKDRQNELKTPWKWMRESDHGESNVRNLLFTRKTRDRRRFSHVSQSTHIRTFPSVARWIYTQSETHTYTWSNRLNRLPVPSYFALQIYENVTHVYTNRLWQLAVTV